ncbi:MAG: carbonic anhydrase family protein [Gammaproteobacteria bacterium]|jgi:carbonic anhydrase
MKPITKQMQQEITPKMALDFLKQGNKRFINNVQAKRNLLEQAEETAKGQYPFAVVLSCIDSRTSAELIFDQGLGDIFSVRIAGNIINEDILGSMEFACKVAGSKVIVVLGHSKCGAVMGACNHVEMGNLSALLAKIKPAIDDEKSITDDRNADNPTFVEQVTKVNVKRVMKDIVERSPILKEMLDNKEIDLIGGYHELSTGEVTFDL